MGYSKAQAGRVRSGIKTTDTQMTDVLSASNTQEEVELNIVASQITLQASGDLAGNFKVSADGVNFVTGASLASSNGMVTYNTHNCAVVQVNWSSGSGKVVILAKS